MATTPTGTDDSATSLAQQLQASLRALAAASMPAGEASPLVMGGPPAGADTSDLRPNLGRRTPPQYSSALAALQRAIY